MNKKILVIEDDKDLSQLLGVHLQDLFLDFDLAHDGNTGLAKAQANHYGLIILDLVLPGIGGLEICREIRSQPHYTPVIMLTSKSTELDRILGLEIGADDYVTKPFSIRELMARVKAVLRRTARMEDNSTEDAATVIKQGKMVISPNRRTTTVNGKVVELTAKEFDLLLTFARHPGRVYSRSQLLDIVWGYHHDGYEHTVNSHINRLRAKIEKNPSQPVYIKTVWGVGYKFSENIEEAND